MQIIHNIFKTVKSFWQNTDIWTRHCIKIGFIAPILTSILIYMWVGSDVPSFKELENPQYDAASIIYDANGQTFGRYYIEDRIEIDFKSLNPYVHTALIATEDTRFYSHSGLDFRSLFRVMGKTMILRDKDSGGGSTISQQLAKLLYQRPDTRGKFILVRMLLLIKSKFKEWITAIKLEKSYTKEEILMMYLNKFEFINGAHGIEAASLTYFGKNQSQLNMQEAATLVGMLKNPSLYNPVRFPDKTVERRNAVLNNLDKNIYNLDSLKKIPLDLSAFKKKSQSNGPAPYFRAELTKWLKQLLSDKKYYKPDGTSYNIYKDGLKIYTTIDLNYQKIAEEVASHHMSTLQKRFSQIWHKKNPWTYEADENQIKLRADILENQCKDTERYLLLRHAYLDNILSDITDNIAQMPLSDNVIKSLIHIQSGDDTQWRNIDINYKTKYLSLIKSNYMGLLVEKFQALQTAYKDEFDKPTPMKVFDFISQTEVDTLMSPLDSVKYHRQLLQCGMLAVDPLSGYVKAWVGGLNHTYFKYDHVTMRRAVGSTIKPFVYTQAMAVLGISPCQEFDDIAYTISPGDASFDLDKEWSPANSTEVFTGNKYNLFHGLLYSKNSITVRLVKEMGTVEPIRNLLSNLGIDVNYKLANGQKIVPNLPSICLGAVDLTLQELVGAYTSFANNGVYTQPIFISHIEDKNGRIIYKATPHKKAAINPLYNAATLAMLRNNVGGKFGLNISTPVGGKTGTTNDYADGWFVAVSPRLVIGSWVGGEDKWMRFLTLDDGQGYVTARPIVQRFLKALETNPTSKYKSNYSFPPAPPQLNELIDCEKYKYISVESEKNNLLKDKKQRDDFDEEF